LAVILILVGIKMLLGDYFEIPIGVTLGTVALVLLISIALSMMYPAKGDRRNSGGQEKSSKL
jgi:predicted tellurium resistance membrane protein TerC